MDMEDLFGTVAEELNEQFGGEEESGIGEIDLSWNYEREREWSLCTHLDEEVSLKSRSVLKRRPLKPTHKTKYGEAENRMATTEFLSQNKDWPVEKNIQLDKKLDRLEKTLQYPKNTTLNPRFQRQKILLRRLDIDKENKSTKQPQPRQANLNVTSQFL
jgi:hypothetical protein